jgi:hypothetical protein
LARAVALGEEEEKREAVPSGREDGIDMEALAKGRPESPCGVLGGGAMMREAGTRG